MKLNKWKVVYHTIVLLFVENEFIINVGKDIKNNIVDWEKLNINCRNKNSFYVSSNLKGRN